MGASNQEIAELRAQMRARMKELDEQIVELAETYVEAHGTSESDEREVETVNAEVPVAGSRTNAETQEITRKKPETYTEEVPVQGGDVEDPETMTVERENSGPSVEDVQEFEGKLNQMRSEATRRQQERANERQEKQMTGAIPQYDYLNTDDADVDESEIPVAGRPNRED
jgi:preprotein translocase subunit SecD